MESNTNGNSAVSNATISSATAASLPSVHGAVPSSKLTQLTESLKLEHQFLRVPFEHYKKTIRANHRAVEKEVSAVMSTLSDSGDLSQDDAVKHLNSLVSRLQGLKRKLEDGSRAEHLQAQRCKARLDHLESAGADNISEWNNTRLKRILVDYMLRMSYYTTATQLAESSHIQDLVDIEIFYEAKRVMDALRNKEVAPALAWCADNKSRLKKSKSKFEFQLRLQEFIELVRNEKNLQAVTYSRKHLSPWAASYMKEFQKVFATLAFTCNTGCETYKVLFDAKQWDFLMEQFKQEFCRLYGMTLEPLLNIYLQAGLSALKTPFCYEDDCPKEDPLSQESFRKLAMPLPYSKQHHSKLVCYITKELMDTENPPLVLPNGYVYSTKALEEMAHVGNKVFCITSSRLTLDIRKEDAFDAMMNQGVTDTITTLDPNSLEHHAVDSSHGQAQSYYASSSAPESASWTMYGAVSDSTGNKTYPSANFSHDQRSEPQSRNLQDGLSVASAGTVSSSGAAANLEICSSQINHILLLLIIISSSSQINHTLSSSQISLVKRMFSQQEPIKVQTSGGYPTANYNTQTNSWNQGSYPSYAHQYPNYTTDSNVAYTAQNNTPVASVQYQQDYSKQWTDYYSQTEVTCAPGTENVSSTTAPNLVSPLPVPVPVPVVANAYSAPNNQQVASTAPVPSSWKPESGLSELPSVQPSAAINNVHESYWKQGSQGYQNYHVTPMQSGFQKPLEAPPQRPNVQQYTSSHLPQTYQPPPQMTPQTSVPFGVNKVQIPTNPRISSNLPKNNNSTIGASKPAYIGVSLPNPNDNTSSHAPAADSADKPGTLPKSLRGYVERALARCKDDRQMAACQNVLKEIITKASTEGTLSTRDWDTEPLFPIPNTDTITNESTPPSLMKNRRSPNRRAKSRWEPLPDEKPVEKQSFFTPESVKSSGGFHSIERDKQFSTGKPENKESNKFSNLRFFLSNQKETNKSGFRPAKRQHIGEGKSAPINNNNNDSSSSDSDKEQGLTAYYASAITLADSPEEKKRRESRSKRFEKNHGNRTTYNNNNNNNKAKNLYTRRASMSMLANSSNTNTSDDSGGASRAVEDIDWDSLTVKGTCQEIEKRYLRLTSAPDPSTVRPEEVLEKALVMVQESQKNYLYKCDQLKSIRQDLTVQRIRNELTVKVYETHARLAIEVGDLSEINQCQSQLQTLYAEGIKGCHMEFSAYNLLCVILHSKNNRDHLSAMSRLSVEARKDEAVKHALAVRAAVTSGNYVLFFRLYKIAPNLNTCLMDLYVEKMRYAAVKCMTRSYRPTLPVNYVAQVLGFQENGLEECTEWLKAHGASLAMDNSGEMMIDAKASMASLFMPEPDDAVSHGDASLAVNDFLTRSLS
ncbi:unnamed protein product [Lactuca saligna]|uniref:PCI domain-containing protein n=1 Tax=Lactuca saligna TaxID=75948 RepID=A0AA35V0X9_LACSI|nr:unnamed protein product [Lactuca saligna]